MTPRPARLTSATYSFALIFISITTGEAHASASGARLIFFQSPQQRAARDPQQLRRQILPSARFFERLPDHLLFQAAQLALQLRLRRGRWRGRLQVQIRGANLPALGQHRSARDGVAQFPHVAGPAVILQRVQSVVSQDPAAGPLRARSDRPGVRYLPPARAAAARGYSPGSAGETGRRGRCPASTACSRFLLVAATMRASTATLRVPPKR